MDLSDLPDFGLSISQIILPLIVVGGLLYPFAYGNDEDFKARPAWWRTRTKVASYVSVYLYNMLLPCLLVAFLMIWSGVFLSALQSLSKSLDVVPSGPSGAALVLWGVIGFFVFLASCMASEALFERWKVEDKARAITSREVVP